MVFVCTTIGWLIVKGPRRARKSNAVVAKAPVSSPRPKNSDRNDPPAATEKEPPATAPPREEPRRRPEPDRPAPAPERRTLSYEKDVLPIMRRSCNSCHGDMRKRAGLDLRTLTSLMRGGENGPAVKPGDPGGSPLLESVTTDRMPTGKKKLTAAEKQVIREWIAGGAKGER